jgi:hypothetical protein
MQAAAHSNKEPNAPPGVTKERAVPFPFGNPTELHGRIKAQYIFGTINHLLTCKSDLAGTPPTPQNPAKLSKPRRPPGGALLLARVVRAIHNYGTRFQVFAKSNRVAARGLGHLFRVNMGQFCPISPCF